MLTFQLKWACNPQPQRGVHLRLPVQAIRTPAQVVVGGKLGRGVVAVTNGVGEDLEPVPVRTRAGTRRVLVGILVVLRGVERPLGIFEFCK